MPLYQVNIRRTARVSDEVVVLIQAEDGDHAREIASGMDDGGLDWRQTDYDTQDYDYTAGLAPPQPEPTPQPEENEGNADGQELAK